MIGTLFKELVLGLRRFIAYRTKRLVGIASPSAAATPAASPTRTTEAEGASPSVPTPVLKIGLAPELLESVVWPTNKSPIESPELEASPLYQLWTSIPGGHKWSQYFYAYERLFSEIHLRPLRILEIGVFRGASIQLWRQYFNHAETLIVGVDIDPKCAVYENPSERVHVRIGSQDDAAFLEQVVSEFGPFDIIIDDGSHRSSHMIKSFNLLFASGLKDRGIYMVEDLHANYWPEWRDSELSFLDLVKLMMEVMHMHYRHADSLAWFWKNRWYHVDSIGVPVLATLIEEIRIFDSMVAIYKTKKAHVPHILFMEGQPLEDGTQ